ncbi:hypothetical protein [Sphingomonas sp.]|uniref:hypothetical protein n=1 Tax=Sphingomonas sp. TaxID=28214 RepID=UPI001B065EC6|nr:hypothetical protein [Sphingomonas sp.]MBO9711958.1 hypothetical protein [Sphingomonas sp.]
MMLSMALALAAAQQAPEIAITPVSKDRYAAVIGDYPVEQRDAVTARMIAAGAERCGKLQVRWGRFSFDTGYTPDGKQVMHNYRQAFSCIDPATDPYKPVAADWKASDKDNADALAFAQRYMAVFDAADAAKGIPMMEAMLEVDKPTWLAQPMQLKGKIGTGSRSFKGPFWRLNPQGASHPGAYAVFVFSGTYSALAAHCGALVLYRDGPGVYHVSQQNVVAISKASIAAGQNTEATAAKACEGY